MPKHTKSPSLMLNKIGRDTIQAMQSSKVLLGCRTWKDWIEKALYATAYLNMNDMWDKDGEIAFATAYRSVLDRLRVSSSHVPGDKSLFIRTLNDETVTNLKRIMAVRDMDTYAEFIEVACRDMVERLDGECEER